MQGGAHLGKVSRPAHLDLPGSLPLHHYRKPLAILCWIASEKSPLVRFLWSSSLSNVTHQEDRAFEMGVQDYLQIKKLAFPD